MEEHGRCVEQAEVKVKGRPLALPLKLSLSLGLILLVGWLGIVFAPGFDRNVLAESSVSQPGVKRKPSVERGRDIFHGTGS
jgi:hypothetical protein